MEIFEDFRKTQLKIFEKFLFKKSMKLVSIKYQKSLKFIVKIIQQSKKWYFQIVRFLMNISKFGENLQKNEIFTKFGNSQNNSL